jgi:hypothetical protein
VQPGQTGGDACGRVQGLAREDRRHGATCAVFCNLVCAHPAGTRIMHTAVGEEMVLVSTLQYKGYLLVGHVGVCD